jgi:adenylate cyclase
MRKYFSRADGFVIAGVLLPALLGLFLMAKLDLGIRRWSYDLLLAVRGRVSVTNAVVVYLDEESHSRLGQSLNEPWKRSLHATLVDRLTRAGAAGVAFDIVFLENRFAAPAEDVQLAEAFQRNGRVVLASGFHYEAGQTNRDPRMDLPLASLRRAAGRRWGHAQMIPSEDQVVRLHPPNYAEDNTNKMSLSWRAAELLKAPLTQVTNLDSLIAASSGERWLNYYGPAYHLTRTPFFAALNTNLTSDDFFRDKLVFVGASTLTKYSGERKDSYRTPFGLFVGDEDDQDKFIPGVEIQATAALNLIRGDWLTRPPALLEQLLFTFVGGLAGLGLFLTRPAKASLLAGALVLVTFVAAYLLFARLGIWTSWLVLLLQIVVAWFYSISVNSVRLHLRNQLLMQTVSRYLSPKLSRKFAGAKAEELLRPGATRHQLTVFFSDIAGFTTVTEGLDPDEFAKLMNQYFETAVGQCVFPTDGTVVKFIGDAIFAIWNAPDPQVDHAWRACEAALRFRSQAILEVKGRPLITRIGLHTGEANVGNFGSRERFDYTAFGESINLASRLEGLNKHLGTLTLMSAVTHAQVEGKFLTRYLGRFVLKGFEKAVEVHELVAKKEDAPQFAELHESFAAGLAAFQSGDREAALMAFEAIAERWPDDGPTQFYLRTLAELGEVTDSGGRAGEVELKEK